ncbi:phage head closure protein [Limosilactobacillus pontis]|uniref:phage head closure protein n=1 Tax=Limosilactobacillus pontis TaxID=35787 RepID=UPI00241DFE98|nr:phage head closure protein [Limosilactobacillus pontis]
MINYDISRMKHRVELGTTKTVTNPYSGVNESKFVPVMSLWCGEYTNTVSQTYTNLGNSINADIVLVVRHNSQLNKQLQVKYKGKEYQIINIDSDDRLNAFDLITLQDKDGLHSQQ